MVGGRKDSEILRTQWALWNDSIPQDNENLFDESSRSTHHCLRWIITAIKDFNNFTRYREES